jgi:hydroxymethylbilane synthase
MLGIGSETVVVRTSGDTRQDVPLEAMEGQGWFTAELERALLDGRADIAVHSAKDLPSRLAPGLHMAALLPRADPRDGLVTTTTATLEQLPQGARVGTSSARRAAVLTALHPGLVPVAVRGNVDTRLRKLDAGEVDALLLACAGLDRIGRGERITQRLDPTVYVPAPAQGAIALEAALGSTLIDRLEALADPETTVAVTAERALLAELGGGCLLPLGAWARVENGRLRLSASLAVDGRLRRAELDGDLHDPATLAAAAAELLA